MLERLVAQERSGNRPVTVLGNLLCAGVEPEKAQSYVEPIESHAPPCQPIEPALLAEIVAMGQAGDLVQATTPTSAPTDPPRRPGLFSRWRSRGEFSRWRSRGEFSRWRSRGEE